jgi:hypothetical protein
VKILRKIKKQKIYITGTQKRIKRRKISLYVHMRNLRGDFMKKGQAALEFLTTYGWAFLVILVMIGALAYFGILNPSGLLPSRCIFSPEIQCLEQQILGDVGGNGYLAFRVRNNAGQMADFNFNATEIATNVAASCLISDGGVSIRAGRIMAVNCTFINNPFSVGDRLKFDISANYTKAGGAYSTPVRGEIYGEVQ